MNRLFNQASKRGVWLSFILLPCTNLAIAQGSYSLVQATRGYEHHVEIMWEFGKVAGTSPITTKIYRSSDGGNTYSNIGETTAGSYIDYLGSQAGHALKTWRYKIQSGNLAFSQPVQATTAPMTDEQFLEMVQRQTFRYFWDFAHPISGLTYEKTSDTAPVHNTVTTGGTGFGIMALPVGVERGWITRQQGIERLSRIVNFLTKNTTARYHGAWPHWMNGTTGVTIPFASNDDGADLVETAFLIQGLLTAKEYFDKSSTAETQLRAKIQTLWEGVEWNWFKQPGNNYLTWHWSPNHGWGDNLPIQGWNEAMVTYMLAISSPTHSVPASLYDDGWARNGAFKSGQTFGSTTLPLGDGTTRGGPLFLTQYSFLGLDPTKIGDKYIDSYYEQGRNQTLINRQYCMNNPGKHTGYSQNCWGLTASLDPTQGYSVHEPSKTGDNGTIAPTAALASMPYTPKESLAALKHFYRKYGGTLWGTLGFKDAFNPSKNWTSSHYMAIDQGPILLMIENYRSQLLWKNFMKNSDLIKGLRAIRSITPDPDGYSYEGISPGQVNIFINNRKQAGWNVSSGSSQNNRLNPIRATVGDELMIEVHDVSHTPSIKGLPDLWVAMAFINEGIFMSSKSITPGAYKPWVPYATVSHTTLALPYHRKWLKEGYQSNRYPQWKKVGDKYRLRWTLQRTMDPYIEGNRVTKDYTHKYADENAPWWQTWDASGNPIVDGTGKFNASGSVPYGKRPKPGGGYPQRQGKNMGLDMVTLHAMQGKLKTTYGQSTDFSDGSTYFVKSDGDDTYTTTFKDLSTKPFNVAASTADLYRPFVELWKVIPDGEMNNPVSAIVTWYQKAIHQEVNDPLPNNYTYDGYEIWEDPTQNPSSKAPGSIKMTWGGRTLWFSLHVQSPLENDKFYTLYKANDNDENRDRIVSTNELTIGMDKHVKTDLVDTLFNNDSKFDLVLGYSTWDPTYTIYPLTLNNDGTLTGQTTFHLNQLNHGYGPGPALHTFISFRRTPESEPVIITGTDFWLSNNIEAMRCEEYRNQTESRTLRKTDFAINALNNENHIDVAKHLQQGYPLSRINDEFTITKGETLTFKLWDNVDFAFKQLDTKWYMSSRKRPQQLEEADAAKRVRITLSQVASNGDVINTQVLQDLNSGNSLTNSHTFNTAGNYIYEAALERNNSGYQVFVRVMEPKYYKVEEEGRVKARSLLPREIGYINATLPDSERINGDDYQLAMVADVQAAYAWKPPSAGGGHRSYMKEGKVQYIDRFAPFNDYADHYVYQLNQAQGTKQSTQNVSAIQKYVTTRDPQFKLLPGVWVNHLDPLGENKNKYGVQDEFNLDLRIQNINSSFVETIFTQVQVTYKDQYTVSHDGKTINSRSPRAWEIRLPWSSLSKYHGFRLRTAPKSPVNAEKLKEAIIKIGKQGGGYFKEYDVGTIGSMGVGYSGGSDYINPLLNHKFGMLDTDEERLEYAFFLNLKYNRWVVIPRTTANIIFYHGEDQSNRIASGLNAGPVEVASLSRAQLTPGPYHLIKGDNQCATVSQVGALSWYHYKAPDGSTNLPACAKVQVAVGEGNARDTLKLNKKYLHINSSSPASLQVMTTGKQVPNYALTLSSEAHGMTPRILSKPDITLVFEQEGLVSFSYKLMSVPTADDANDSMTTTPVVTSTSHRDVIIGAVVGSLAVGGITGATVYLVRRLLSNRSGYQSLPSSNEAGEIGMCKIKSD